MKNLDSCGERVCFADENHQNYIELSFKGTGYTAYGGGKNAYCHKTGKKINELVGCKLWKRQK